MTHNHMPVIVLGLFLAAAASLFACTLLRLAARRLRRAWCRWETARHHRALATYHQRRDWEDSWPPCPADQRAVQRLLASSLPVDASTPPVPAALTQDLCSPAAPPLHPRPSASIRG